MNIAANATPEPKRHDKPAPRQSPERRDPNPDKGDEQPDRRPRRPQGDDRGRRPRENASPSQRKPH